MTPKCTCCGFDQGDFLGARDLSYGLAIAAATPLAVILAPADVGLWWITL